MYNFTSFFLYSKYLLVVYFNPLFKQMPDALFHSLVADGPLARYRRRQVHIDLVDNVLIHVQVVLLLLDEVKVVLVVVVIVVVEVVGHCGDDSKQRYSH